MMIKEQQKMKDESEFASQEALVLNLRSTTFWDLIAKGMTAFMSLN